MSAENRLFFELETEKGVVVLIYFVVRFLPGQQFPQQTENKTFFQPTVSIAQCIVGIIQK